MERFFFLNLAALMALAAPGEARIVRIAVEHTDSLVYNGQSFGGTGRYQRLSGLAYGELDPKAPLNAIITDLQLAPRNARGMVEYSATFVLVKPIDLCEWSP